MSARAQGGQHGADRQCLPPPRGEEGTRWPSGRLTDSVFTPEGRKGAPRRWDGVVPPGGRTGARAAAEGCTEWCGVEREGEREG
eukprot:254882-Chlamydomonas_euryale.AAC.1